MTRLESLQVEIARQGIDLAIVSSAANTRYLIGVPALGLDRVTVLLVTPASAAMVLPDFDVPDFVARTGFTHVFPWADSEGPAGAVRDAFQDLEVAPTAHVVVDLELPFRYYAELVGHLSRATVDRGDLLEEIRLIKDDAELEKMARAGSLVSTAVEAGLDAARPGLTELELCALINAELMRGGAAPQPVVLVQAGAHSAAPHHVADYSQLREGQPVLIDVAASLDGYYADITVQVHLGAPSERYARAYAALRAAQQAGFEAAQPGARVSDIESATRSTVEAGGFSQDYRTGHGIGLDVHEPPSVVDGNTVTLRPGMTFTIEPGIYLPGEFGIRIEDTVAVSEDGPRRLTRGARPLSVRGQNGVVTSWEAG
jgi:Xaa-Pro dipeptidase